MRHSRWPLGAHINSRDIRPIQLEKIRHEMKLWIVPSVSQRQNILTGTTLIPTGITRPGLAGPGIKGRGRFKWMEEREENLWQRASATEGRVRVVCLLLGWGWKKSQCTSHCTWSKSSSEKMFYSYARKNCKQVYQNINTACQMMEGWWMVFSFSFLLLGIFLFIMKRFSLTVRKT